MRIVTGIGGFTVAWFAVMLENLTKGAHGLPFLEILMGRLKDSIFTRQNKMAHELRLSLLVNQQHTLKRSRFLF